jgi:tetrahedral aminopeptidase
MDTFDLVKQLTETPGPSGFEQSASEFIQGLWQPLTDDVYIDHVGSVLATRHGTSPDVDNPSRPVIMLAAHADELGLLVAQVLDQDGYGFLRVTGLGGVDRRQLFGQSVIVHGRHLLPAVIGGLPDHLLPETDRGQAYSYEQLVVDPGLRIDDLRAEVSIGDFISFRQPLRKLLSGRAGGKALDNRVSIAALTLCLQYLQGRQHFWNVLAVATSQEETRFLGAYTSAFTRRPDAAVAIDVTHAKGPGSNDSELAELGSGPVLGIGSNVHPGIYQALKDAAKAIEMSVSTEPHAYGSGTDAYAIQIAREGIPTGLVEIPLRYMHTMVETADMNDIERVGRLLAEFIVRLDDQFLPHLTKSLMKPDKKHPASHEANDDE